MNKTATWLVGILFLFTGCASSPVQPTGKPSAVFLDVPFYPDRTDQCGPSTLASLLTYWGKNTEPAKLKEDLYLAKLNGTLPMDLALTAQTHGLVVEMARGELERVRAELQAGRPVIAMLNRGWAVAPVYHYVVITGFDDAKHALIAHSGGGKDRRYSYSTFLRQWKRTDYWTLFSQPTERQALALGNAAFAKEEWKKAERYFTQAHQAAPQDAAAANNLAMTYVVQGKNLARAKELIDQALPTAGPLRPYLLDTAAEIHRRQGHYALAERALEAAAQSPPPQDKDFLNNLQKSRQKLAQAIENPRM